MTDADDGMPSKIDWASLSVAAWAARENAWLDKSGRTKVGAAVLADNGKVYAGCNMQHMYRCHDIHAEPAAIANAAADGAKSIKAILVAAERENFTPCGSCLDWIVEAGGLDCEVAVQESPTKGVTIFKARLLMPFYPGINHVHPTERRK